MLQKGIEQLKEIAFSQSLKQIKKDRIMKRTKILGFDTEYDNETNELLSIQLSFKDNNFIKYIGIGEKLTWHDLGNMVKNFLKSIGENVGKNYVSSFILVSFFSIAEVQHFPYIDKKILIEEYGAGNYNFSFPFNRRKNKKTGKYQTIQTLQIIDLQTWFRGMNLAYVAKTFGLKKLDYPNITKMSRQYLDSLDKEEKKYFEEYAINDSILCEKIFNELRENFLQIYNIDILLTKTPANTSMTIFRKHYLTEDCNNPLTEVRRMALLCSWGGNNQAFCQGSFTGIFSEYDAKSMYPSSAIMINKLPTAYSWIMAVDLKDFLDPKNIGGICKVNFSFSNNIKYPCLPVMEKGKLLYPLNGQSFCTLYELQYAKEQGAEIEFLQGYYYRDGNTDLSSYLKDVIAKKDEAEENNNWVMRTIFKLMANSIIGKFTQKVVKHDINELKDISYQLEIPLGELLKIHDLEDLGVEKKINLGSGFYPEWNTLILGYARMVLARAFSENNAMVGTTDSLIFRGKKIKNKKIKGIIFEKESEGDILTIVRTRFYMLLNSRKHKDINHIALHGVRNYQKAISILRLYPLIKKHKNEKYKVNYSTNRILKLRESLKEDKKMGFNEQKDYEVFLHWDNKRELIDGGKDSLPLKYANI